VTEQQKDFPFYEVVKNAQEQMLRGFLVFQKFTCQGCGTRQTMETPNTFYMEGTCEECHHITNIVKAGCNFLLVAVAGGSTVRSSANDN
jgi:hypothetical protein